MYNSKSAKRLIEIGAWNWSDAAAMWLEALERAGVDNWDGIEEAKEIFKGFVEEELDNNV